MNEAKIKLCELENLLNLENRGIPFQFWELRQCRNKTDQAQ